jgi:HAD superfamily hydrolase (TIGR01509 family)
LREALAASGRPCPPPVLAEYRRINDLLWAEYRLGRIPSSVLKRERFRRLLAWLGADPRGARVLGERFLDRLSQHGDRLPGCRALLERLSHHLVLGVVTNGIDRVQRSRLAVSGLAQFFQTIVTSESCGFAKPDPRILGVALRELGLKAKQAVYVGDDPSVDGAVAEAAGVPFVWVDRGAALPPGTRRPRRRVRALNQVPAALGL